MILPEDSNAETSPGPYALSSQEEHMRAFNPIGPAVWLALLIASPLAHSDAPELRPALFGDADNSIDQVVRCPADARVDDGIVMVFCQAQIQSNGAPRHQYCFADGGQSNYQRAAMTALSESVFAPATADGEPISVYKSFRLAFINEGDTCAVAAIPNKGYHAGTYGLAYIEPQEVVPSRGWYPRRADTTRVRVNRAGIMLNVGMDVDENGQVSNVVVETQNFGPRRVRNEATRAMERATFIPGFVDSTPTAMRAYEFFYVEPDSMDIRMSPGDPGGGGGRGVP